MTRAPRIKVAIDRLVLHGGNPHDAAGLRSALAAELSARLASADAGVIAEQGARAPRRLDIGAGDAASLGTEAGRALASALGAPANGRGR